MLARVTLSDDLDDAHRELTLAVLRETTTATEPTPALRWSGGSGQGPEHLHHGESTNQRDARAAGETNAATLVAVRDSRPLAGLPAESGSTPP